MSKKDEESFKKQSLDYHSQGRKGKIEVRSTKSTISSNDLSKAYSPGVSYPCLEIAKNPHDAYKYTAKGNLVGVISNGSAVLGLGNIGALAGKPVMEGKGVLFKRFADIDVFDIEVNESTVEGMVKIVKALEPTFGGINLEDIKAPECFEIESQLVEAMDIPVFHDDQHGTAIIAAAGFINSLEITNRKIKDVKVVFSGAGAAAIACARLLVSLGINKKNLLMCDSKGVIYKGRANVNKYKAEFASESTKARTIADALNGADAFLGVSAKGVVSKEMIKTMNKNPIIFAMANPDPEINPEDVYEARPDAIMATGRSDYPNQVNNVLGFPSIFRGALDTQASTINEAMKHAAVKALADLAKEEVTEEVRMAYDNEDFTFGPNYIIPKPFDERVLVRVATAVAKAAIDSGVARHVIKDIKEYESYLVNRLSHTASFMKNLRDRLDSYVKKDKKKVRMVFAEGINTRILETVKMLNEKGRVEPILLGKTDKIKSKMKELGLTKDLKNIEIVDTSSSPLFKDFYHKLSKERQREGVSLYHAEDLMEQENYFGSMMLKEGHTDVFMAGPTLSYASCLKPMLTVLGTEDEEKISGIYILVFQNRVLFFTDCTSQADPSVENLANIAKNAAVLFKQLMRREPRISFLSYSNFGSNNHPKVKKVRDAVNLTKELYPELLVEGEMQADVATNKQILDILFDFNEHSGPSDILVFPELNSANISYKLLSQLAEVSLIGPILVPMNAASNIIPRTASIPEIVNLCHLTALLSKEREK